jgi:hypothetical protein
MKVNEKVKVEDRVRAFWIVLCRNNSPIATSAGKI